MMVETTEMKKPAKEEDAKTSSSSPGTATESAAARQAATVEFRSTTATLETPVDDPKTPAPSLPRSSVFRKRK